MYSNLWKFAVTGAIDLWISKFLRRYGPSGTFDMYVFDTFSEFRGFSWFHDGSVEFKTIVKAMHTQFYNTFIFNGGFVCDLRYTIFSQRWADMLPAGGDSWHLPKHGAFSWGVVALALDLYYIAYLHSRCEFVGHFGVLKEAFGCMFLYRAFEVHISFLVFNS